MQIHWAGCSTKLYIVGAQFGDLETRVRNHKSMYAVNVYCKLVFSTFEEQGQGHLELSQTLLHQI